MVVPGEVSRISFLASSAPLAQDSRARLAARYGDVAPENAQVIVALGGDGFMLETLHRQLGEGGTALGLRVPAVHHQHKHLA